MDEDEVFQPITLIGLVEGQIPRDEQLRLLRQALRARTDGSYVYIRDVFDNYVTYILENHSSDDTLYRRDYTIDNTGKVTFGDAKVVVTQVEHIEISESQQPTFSNELLSEGHLLESADGGEGWRWQVQIIEAGISGNRNEYPLSVLHRRAGLYEAVPVFYGRGRDHNPAERGFDNIAGYIRHPKPNAAGVEGTLEINRGKPELRESFLQAWELYQETGKRAFGFSHVIPTGKFTTTIRRIAEGLIQRITDFTQVESVDIVMQPAAGGALIGLVAGLDDGETERSLAVLEELLRRLRAGEQLSESEMEQLYSEAPAETARALAEARTADPPGNDDEPAGEPATGALSEAEDILQRLALTESRLALQTALAESRLPEIMQEAIRSDFGGRVFEAADLESRISRDRDMAARLIEGSRGLMPNSGSLRVTEDEREKHVHALDGMLAGRDIEGVARFQSIKEAFRVISGSPYSYIDPRLARQILQESVMFVPETEEHLRESVQTSTWAELLGDSITRRMIAEYGQPNLSTWRAIVSDTPPINDFRTQRRMVMGGYGDLPTVAQGATYNSLTSPGDAESTYSPAKYGGTDDLTMETIVNDDVGAVRRIPRKLGRAAARTLYHAIWNTTIRDNATFTQDSTALYHANHSNTGTTALSAASLLAVENAMRDQMPYGVSVETLGEANMPKILAVPNELRDTAFRLTQSSVAVSTAADDTEPNIFLGNGYTVIVVDDWTDANNWYAFANPMETPILEVGFLGGREDPELFVQDQPNVGSNFTADKVTYKIRHIWGIGILDYRGTYGQIVT